MGLSGAIKKDPGINQGRREKHLTAYQRRIEYSSVFFEVNLTFVWKNTCGRHIPNGQSGIKLSGRRAISAGSFFEILPRQFRRV